MDEEKTDLTAKPNSRGKSVLEGLPDGAVADLEVRFCQGTGFPAPPVISRRIGSGSRRKSRQDRVCGTIAATVLELREIPRANY